MNNDVQPPPWCSESSIHDLVRGFTRGHAILLNGPEGMGKHRLASLSARALLGCDTDPGKDALFRAGTHPDLHVLTSASGWGGLDPALQKHALRYLDPQSLEKKKLSRQISVDTVRAMVASLEEAAAYSGYKVVVILPAEHMNINASNALLKFLEEPTRDTLLLPVCHDISRLAATVRSRCMKYNLVMWDSVEIVTWLREKYPDHDPRTIEDALSLAGNRPLLAHRYLEAGLGELAATLGDDVCSIVANRANPVAVARNWLKFRQTDFILDWMRKLVSDLLRMKLGSGLASGLYHDPEKLESLVRGMDTNRLFGLYDWLNQLERRNDGVIDETLLIEELILALAGTEAA